MNTLTLSKVSDTHDDDDHPTKYQPSTYDVPAARRTAAMTPTQKMTSPITCHVLDSSLGLPAPGVRVHLYLLDVPAGSASLTSGGGASASAEQGQAEAQAQGQGQAATAGPSAAGAASGGEREGGTQPRLLASGETNADGRCTTLLDPSAPAPVLIGGATYKMRFETGAYFRAKGTQAFYPYVEIPFTLATPAAKHYHIPLLLAPFSYTTYRGS